MKTLNIFAIILIVSFVSATRKLVTYEDLVTSFSQLDDPQNDALGKLENIGEAFKESNQLLTNTRDVIEGYCNKMNVATKNLIGVIGKNMKQFTDETEELKQSNLQHQNAIQENLDAQKEEVTKINAAYIAIRNSGTEQQAKESEIVEVLRVLNRLQNLASDELVGNHRVTRMTNYTIVNEHGVSFIQKSNMKQELKGILSKSSTSGKALISSLILLATNDDGNFADQEKVNRVIEVLGKIIHRNEERLRNLKVEFEETKNSQMEIVNNSQQLIEQLREEAAKTNFDIEVNNRQIAMNNNEVLYLQRMNDRKSNKVKFDNKICQDHLKVMDNHRQKYTKTQERINAIKESLI